MSTFLAGEGPQQPRKARQIVAVVAVFALSFALALGGRFAWHHWQAAGAAPVAGPVPIPVLAPVRVQTPAQASASPAAQVAAAPAPKAWVDLVLNGQRLTSPVELALPDGSVFSLALKCDQIAQVEVFATNPSGQTTRLWAAQLVPGQEWASPNLRLAGPRGEERIKVIFHTQSGGSVARSLKILHT